MKKIYIFICICALSLVSTTSYAAINTQVKPVTTFTMSTGEITRSSKTDDVKFNLKVDKIVNPQSIAFWKIRTYCDDDMSIQLTATSSDSCRKAIKVDSFKDNAFSFIFKNDSSMIKKFSLKLKAYDMNGKWLHTDTEAFNWK